MFAKQPPDQRVLVATPAEVRVTFADQDGTATSASSTVLCSVERYDGTAVVTSASTTVGSTAGVYEANLTATHTASLDQLTCKWYDGGTLRATTHVEVVGGFYFSIAEARASDPTLADVARYPDADILRARNEVEFQCEQITHAAWVPRFTERTVTGRGNRIIALPDPQVRTIRAVDPANGTAFTATDLADCGVDGYVVTRQTSGFFPCDLLAVAYEHGYHRPPPDLRAATLRHLRHQLNTTKTGIDERTLTVTNEFGTTTFAVAGRAGFETGLPEVDAVYGRYRHDPQVVI